MVISSRTPEGQPNSCPVCGKAVVMEPSQPFGDAPCPHCGCLLRFAPLGEDIRVWVARPAAKGTASAGAGSMYVCPQCKTRIPCGTETEPPASRCPTCQRRLWIPTTRRTLPGHVPGPLFKRVWLLTMAVSLTVLAVIVGFQIFG